MSKTLSRDASRVRVLAPSTLVPDGFRRGPLVPEPADDTVGDAIFTSAPVPEVEDEYSAMAATAEAEEKARAVRLTRLAQHMLVREYGFPANGLVPFGFEVLAMAVAACRAADELTRLKGNTEVCKVLGWTDECPKTLAVFGIVRLSDHVGALQARVEEIRAAQRVQEAAHKGGIRPRGIMRAPVVAPARPAPRPEPGASVHALMARIQTAQLASDRQKSLGARRMLDQALATLTEVRAQELVEQAEQMLRVCEASPLPKSRPAQPTRGTLRAPASHQIRSPGKTARKREKEEARRAEARAAAAAKPTAPPAPKAEASLKKGKNEGRKEKKKGK